jgi:hypothetical protein
MISRDSIVNIRSSLKKNIWMKILFQFSQKAMSLKGSGSSKKLIEADLKSLNDNFEGIQESEFGELYKHIIERWTNETYESVMSNVAIDLIEGQQSPCRM